MSSLHLKGSFSTVGCPFGQASLPAPTPNNARNLLGTAHKPRMVRMVLQVLAWSGWAGDWLLGGARLARELLGSAGDPGPSQQFPSSLQSPSSSLPWPEVRYVQ